ncbi:uncharacterized protein EI97DRAFT_361297, partial [Westerdykella ornata]
IPPRPPGVDPAAFHASQFDNFDAIAEKYGFDDLNPAVQHAPVFLYARTDPTMDPCYPEGALNHGSCGNAYSKGGSFPVYVSAAYCPDKEGHSSEGEWRINYDVYYVHD